MQQMYGILLLGIKNGEFHRYEGVQLHDRQRTGIAAGGEFIERPARKRCPVKK